MNPGLEPAKRQSIESMNAAMAQSIGKSAGRCILNMFESPVSPSMEQ